MSSIARLIAKRRVRYAALATGAAVAASLTISGGGPPSGGDGQGGTQARTQPPAAKGGTQAQTQTPPANGRTDGGTDGRTIRVEANLRVGEELDLGTPGRSVGDQFVFSGDLFSRQSPADGVVGRLGGFCVITGLERNSGECSLSAVLPGGQIAVQGEQAGIPTPSPVANAITGGTGEFRNAQGQMTLRVLTPATWELTFQVTDR